MQVPVRDAAELQVDSCVYPSQSTRIQGPRASQSCSNDCLTHTLASIRKYMRYHTCGIIRAVGVALDFRFGTCQRESRFSRCKTHSNGLGTAIFGRL